MCADEHFASCSILIIHFKLAISETDISSSKLQVWVLYPLKRKVENFSNYPDISKEDCILLSPLHISYKTKGWFCFIWSGKQPQFSPEELIVI